MKKLIAIACIMLSCFMAMSQTIVTVDAAGNIVATRSGTTSQAGKLAGTTYTDTKGIVYPLMISSKGKLYYMKMSKKTGKPYRAYPPKTTIIL